MTPKITKRPKTVKVRLPEDIYEALWDQARREGSSATAVIERALRAELARLASQETAGAPGQG